MNTNRIVKNALWIIGAQIVKAILGVLITMVTARYLGPSNYGLINYAASIVAFVAPIMYLGLNNTLVQEIVSNTDNEGEILGTAIGMSLVSSILCIAGVAAFVSIVNRGERDTLIVCALYSILLIFQSVDLINYWFQAKLLSKCSSLASLCAYLAVSAYKLFLLVTGKNIYWFAVSNALDYMLIAGALLIAYRKIGTKPLRFSPNTARRLFVKSKYYIVPSMMVSIFSQTDRIMLKLLIGETATGFYSAAVDCVGMTGFVFSAIISSYRPVIYETKNRGQEQFENSIRNLYSVIIYLSLLQCIAITVFAGIIMRLLYGEQYMASIPVLRLIVWYTPFSYLGAVRNIWILSENKQSYLWIINLCGALANIVLNLILIPVMGTVGAALASLITQIFTNVIMGFIVKPIRYNNHLVVQSLNPRYIHNIVKQMVTK